MSIRDNIERVRAGIADACAAAGRAPEEVTLMAVTKTVPPERINEALDCGITHIGENRVQEFLGKRDALALHRPDAPVQAHLIGHLQTNKVNAIVGRADMIQSVDSLRLAGAIQRRAEQLAIAVPVLVEVNIGGEGAKSGVLPEDLAGLLDDISEYDRINVRGLMAIPPIFSSEKEKRAIFAKMYQVFIDMRAKKRDNIGMCILSMGMSGDFREAVREGSTLVRVGTGIFGGR